MKQVSKEARIIAIIASVFLALAVLFFAFLYLLAPDTPPPSAPTAKQTTKQIEDRVDRVAQELRAIAPHVTPTPVKPPLRARKQTVIVKREQQPEQRIYFGGDLVTLPNGQDWPVPSGLLMMVQKNQTAAKTDCVANQKSYLDLIKQTRLLVPCHLDLDPVTRWQFHQCFKEERVNKIEVDPTCNNARARLERKQQ